MNLKEASAVTHPCNTCWCDTDASIDNKNIIRVYPRCKCNYGEVYLLQAWLILNPISHAAIWIVRDKLKWMDTIKGDKIFTQCKVCNSISEHAVKSRFEDVSHLHEHIKTCRLITGAKIPLKVKEQINE